VSQHKLHQHPDHSQDLQLVSVPDDRLPS